MLKRSAQRRTQFSSCDGCRRSRVGCDASTFGHQPGKVRWAGSCSRCSLKKKPCTFEWINNVKNKPSNSGKDAVLHSSTPGPQSPISYGPHDRAAAAVGSELIGRSIQDYGLNITPNSHSGTPVDVPNQANLQYGMSTGESDTFVPESLFSEPVNSQAEFVDVLAHWSEHIFHHGFETIFGLLVGRNGCPFVNNPRSDICIPSTKLFRKLDADMNGNLNNQNPGYVQELWERRSEKENQMDQSLSLAIQSFVARWLPLLPERSNLATSQVEEIIRESWRTARKDMLKVINRTSYRSTLTLYIFAQTPIPVGISEEEELDGVTGLLCIQTALLQIQKLRDRQRSRQFDGSEVLAREDAFASVVTSSSFPQSFLDFESRVYWAAVIWDTSSSFTWDLKTSLTSGLNGACSEPAWRLARTFIVGSFHSETEDWHKNNFDASDKAASQIIAAAAVSKLYVWKNITSFKEAVREGVDEKKFLFVWNALLDAINIYETSIRPLLNSCERRLHFMSELNRRRWYQVSLQYYLGILVLVDVIEVANLSDLLPHVNEARQDAEYESFNVLKFGAENTYTINRPRDSPPNNVSRSDAVTDFPGEPITVSFITIDPCPYYVIDSVLLMNKVISRKYRQGEIKQEAYNHLSSTLLKALGQLSQSSKTVRAAHVNLQQSLAQPMTF